MLISFTSFSENIMYLHEGVSVKAKWDDHKNHVYAIKINKGNYFECAVQQNGIDLIINIEDPLGDITVFDSPNGENGLEYVSYSAASTGQYKMIVYSESEHIDDSSNYIITDIRFLSPSMLRKKQYEDRKEQQEFVHWVNDHAHPLHYIEAENGFDDLKWMKSSLSTIQYVGIGEATHGTKEFFQTKHRLLEFFVKEMGFTYFCLEASYSGCRNINDYVLYGKGDASSALTSQGFWTWNTEEILNMIEWIKKYNLTVPLDRKVKFYGFDIQKNSLGGGLRYIIDFVQKVAPDLKHKNDSLFRQIEQVEKLGPSSVNAKNVRQQWAEFSQILHDGSGHYINSTTIEEYELLTQYMKILSQYIDVYLMSEDDYRMGQLEWRDYYMASNLMDLASKDTSAKMLIWAHNNHINKNPGHYVNGNKRPLGSYLHNVFKDKYYAFGFLFNQGSFQAVGVDSNGKGDLREFTVSEAKKGSFENLLSQNEMKNFMVNFRLKDIPTTIDKFCNKEFYTRNYGSMISLDYEYDDFYWTPMKISTDFDGIIFINNTTRSISTKTGTR